MNVTLWIAQIILALMFIMAGVMKTFSPIGDLAAQLVWPGEVPSLLVRFIGVSELLGGLGLILPSILKMNKKWTAFAALGLGLIMILALLYHLYKGEMFALPVNIAIGLIAFFVAWGRNKELK